MIVVEDTHYDKANENEGGCFLNYDNDDEVLDVDNVNGRDDDDEDREAVSEKPPVNNQLPMPCRSMGVIRLSRHFSQVFNQLETLLMVYGVDAHGTRPV